jgi:hypothetical protein
MYRTPTAMDVLARDGLTRSMGHATDYPAQIVSPRLCDPKHPGAGCRVARGMAEAHALVSGLETFITEIYEHLFVLDMAYLQYQSCNYYNLYISRSSSFLPPQNVTPMLMYSVDVIAWRDESGALRFSTQKGPDP